MTEYAFNDIFLYVAVCFIVWIFYLVWKLKKEIKAQEHQQAPTS